MARSPIKVAIETDVTPPAKETLDFDDDTLRAIAEVYKNQGNEEYRKRDFVNAIHFYTEGLKVNCKDQQMNVKLYSNRAIANFKLGKYVDSLNDAKAATRLQPIFLKAIVRGASACVQLNWFEEAFTWCENGLAGKDTKDVTETAQENAVSESEDTASVEKALDYDDNGSLRGKAEVYKNKGNYEYSTKNLSNAIHFYTEGIKVNCNDDELNAKLYSNRAIAHFYLGNYENSLRDARAATDSQPTFLKAIERGACACMKLNRFGEVITWCDKGLAIDKSNKKLLELRIRSVKEQNKKQKPDGDSTENNSEIHTVKDKVDDLNCPNAKRFGDKAEKAHFYGNLGNAFLSLGDFRKAIDYYVLCLKIAKEKGDKAGEAKAYGNLGNAFLSLGDFRKAIDYFELHLKIAKEIRDKAGKGDAYGNLGKAFLYLGDFRKAIDYYKLLLKIAKQVGDKAGEGKTYSNLGNAFLGLGDFRKAIDYYELCLKIAKEVGDKAAEASANGNLGNAFLSLGDFRKAIDYYELHLKIAKEVGNKAGEGSTYGNLGNAFLNLGDFTKATDYYELCLKIAKEVGNKAGEGKAYGNLGNAFCNLGDFTKAIDYYELHLKIAKEVGNKAGEGSSYGNLGNAFLNLGDFRKAIDYYELCLKIAKDVGNKAGEGSTYGNLGNAFLNLGDFTKATDYYELCLKIAKEVGNKAGEGSSYGNLGNAFLNLGDFRKAIDYYELCLKIAKEVGNKAGEGSSYGNLGNAFLNLGDFRKAIDYYELHLKIAKEVGDKAGEGKAYGNLGNAFRNLSDFRTAIDYYELHLKIAKEVGDKAGKGSSYGNLGNAFSDLSDFRQAIDYYELHLKIAKEVGDKAGEGSAYGNLGNAFLSLGDFRKAIDYYELCIKIAKEVGDKAGEGKAYGNLGNAFCNLSDFRQAMDYYELHLKIAKEIGNKAGEGSSYGNLGNAFLSLGDFRKAIDYYELHLKIAKEVGDKAGEASAYGNLGNAFSNLSDFRQAIDYYELNLKIAKEVGDKAGEGRAYGNLGNAFFNLGDFRKAIDYYKLHLKIAKEVGDKAGEGNAYGNFGNAFRNLSDFRKAIDYYELALKIAKEVGDKNGEAKSYHNLGRSFESQGSLSKALEYYERSVRLFNHVRNLLQSKDEWKIDYRNEVDVAYTHLWRVLLKQGKMVEALCAAERGRAQALTDLMLSQFGIRESQLPLQEEEEQYFQLRRSLPSSTVFQGFGSAKIHFWVLSKERPVRARTKEIGEAHSVLNDATAFYQSLIKNAFRQIRFCSEVRCENRSLDAFRESRHKVVEKSDEENTQPFVQQESSLSTLYNILIQPIDDLIQGNELIIVPHGPLWLAPYAALVDGDSKYLCDSFRIRLIPSLTSLRLIAECPDDYHSRSGALLVGDPWVEEVINSKGEKFLDPLPFARKEAEMIGEILNVKPLIGKKATKYEVLKELSSVALVHIAAHGCMETGEIALTPNPERTSSIPTVEDYILKMADVLSAKMRARLVVLSCCHSGRGEIKAEGVVGIARAFMGAGARSVLVSLWAIDDEATLEFMKCFYHNLVEGRSASDSLNQAMKDLRKSDKYSDVKYWAPFVLIGDDVTLDFHQKK
ncbi:hypothetical protein ACROYT_G010284 [Oculina patagonica]